MHAVYASSPFVVFWQGRSPVVISTLIHIGCFITLRPRRNVQHFADDIFKRIFFNENVWISIKISLKLVPEDPINNIPALEAIIWTNDG